MAARRPAKAVAWKVVTEDLYSIWTRPAHRIYFAIGTEAVDAFGISAFTFAEAAVFYAKWTTELADAKNEVLAKRGQPDVAQWPRATVVELEYDAADFVAYDRPQIRVRRCRVVRELDASEMDSLAITQAEVRAHPQWNAPPPRGAGGRSRTEFFDA